MMARFPNQIEECEMHARALDIFLEIKRSLKVRAEKENAATAL
jgi:hypothetical protein